MADLSAQFQKDMLADSREYTLKTKTNPSRYLQMIAEQGGVETARQLASDPRFHEGFTRAWEYGCLDLTAEYLIVFARDGAYQPLFTTEVIASARKKLADVRVKSAIIKS